MDKWGNEGTHTHKKKKLQYDFNINKWVNYGVKNLSEIPKRSTHWNFFLKKLHLSLHRILRANWLINRWFIDSCRFIDGWYNLFRVPDIDISLSPCSGDRASSSLSCRNRKKNLFHFKLQPPQKPLYQSDITLIIMKKLRTRACKQTRVFH